MSVLARAASRDLEAAWAALATRPVYRVVRTPELGMVMLRGRAGGSGPRFNLGEMTVTRCSVEVESGATGHAYVAGRDLRHAELAAVFDALLQDGRLRDTLERSVIAPFEEAQRESRHLAASRSAASKIEFFTLVRGED
jgi:alpha-D-ribose 1-methylphosphonate 5-triphosphate synthase subunit PhnG